MRITTTLPKSLLSSRSFATVTMIVPTTGSNTPMDEFELMEMEDFFERLDDYNVFEEREIMYDNEGFEEEDLLEDQHIDAYWEEI